MTPSIGTRCRACGSPAKAGSQFCTDCGARLPEGCHYCGVPLKSGSLFCTNCGKRVGNTLSLRRINWPQCFRAYLLFVFPLLAAIYVGDEFKQAADRPFDGLDALLGASGVVDLAIQTTRKLAIAHTLLLVPISVYGIRAGIEVSRKTAAGLRDARRFLWISLGGALVGLALISWIFPVASRWPFYFWIAVSTAWLVWLARSAELQIGQ